LRSQELANGLQKYGVVIEIDEMARVAKYIEGPGGGGEMTEKQWHDFMQSTEEGLDGGDPAKPAKGNGKAKAKSNSKDSEAETEPSTDNPVFETDEKLEADEKTMKDLEAGAQIFES
jgi:hypothetical protein